MSTGRSPILPLVGVYVLQAAFGRGEEEENRWVLFMVRRCDSGHNFDQLPGEVGTNLLQLFGACRRIDDRVENCINSWFFCMLLFLCTVFMTMTTAYLSSSSGDDFVWDRVDKRLAGRMLMRGVKRRLQDLDEHSVTPATASVGGDHVSWCRLRGGPGQSVQTV